MIGSKSDNNFDSVIFYLGFLAHGLFVQFVESFKNVFFFSLQT